jgi:cysteine synthase
MKIAPDITRTVGRTPIVALPRIGRDLPAWVVAKLESRNPCGSVQDRVGIALIEDAET